MTYRVVANDIIKTFKSNFDDADLRLSQVVYWVMVVSNRISYSIIEKGKHGGKYLCTFDNVEVKDDAKGKKYIDLPAGVYDLQYESGIEYITYEMEDAVCDPPTFTQVSFEPTTPSRASRLYMRPLEQPSPSQPFFYRVKDRLYFLGVENTPMDLGVEIGVYAGTDPSKICELDDEVPLGDEHIHTLIQEVLKLGSFLYQQPLERTNDGNDRKSEDNASLARARARTRSSRSNQQTAE